MVQLMVQRLMEINVEGRCGAGYNEKSAARLNSRNVYRDRTWETRAATVELKIPKLRQGSYFPEFLEPRRTAEKALIAVIQEAYVQGIFPNDCAITRLVGAMMLEQNDEWSLNRRYMQLEGLQSLCDTAPTRLSAVAR